MSKEVEFYKELDKLYHQRIHWLRTVFGAKKPGPPPKFNRKKVDRGIEKLQTIASDALANKLAKEEFSKFAPTKRAWHVKGRGYDQKRKLFDEWFEKSIGNHQECVYAFWGRRKYIYWTHRKWR